MLGSRFAGPAAAALALTLTLSAGTPAGRPADEPLGREIDALFADYDRRDAPGYAVAVVRDGRVVHARGYGMADLERDVPITTKTVFDIGSTGKQFSAMCVMILARQGKLLLDDEVRKHLPELRDYGAPLTIRHLLGHTSGIRDYLELMSMAGMSDGNDYPDRQIVDLIARQRELNFRPGDEYLYSNSGYFLVSAIVPRVSGMSLREFARRHVFEPLGMTSTHFHDDTAEIVRNRAIGYAPKEGGGYRISMSPFHVVGDGGVLTTVEDLAIWDRNFYDNKLEGGQEVIREMTRSGVLNKGERTGYGLGLRVGEYRDLPTVRHGGAWVGYRAEVLRFPEQRVTVICLANSAAARPSAMAERVADAVLAGSLGPRPADARADGAPGGAAATGPKAAPHAAEQLGAYAGDYYSEELGAVSRMTVAGGRLLVAPLYAEGVALEPAGRDEFAGSGVTVVFSRDASGAVTGFSMRSGRVKNLAFERRP